MFKACVHIEHGLGTVSYTHLDVYKRQPLLSTKIPLKEDDIYFLKDSGIKFLQFSLDSIFTSTLQTMVRVKEDYIDNVKQMFEYS